MQCTYAIKCRFYVCQISNGSDRIRVIMINNNNILINDNNNINNNNNLNKQSHKNKQINKQTNKTKKI